MTETAPVYRERMSRFAEYFVQNGGNARDAARKAGYSTASQNSLDVTASRLLRNPKVIAHMERIRSEIKEAGTARQVNQVRIDTQDKRQFLWKLAQDCGRIVREEEISEHEDAQGRLIRTITATERVFMPRDAIDAIHELNEMDGDLASTKPSAAMFSIENALMMLPSPTKQ